MFANLVLLFTAILASSTATATVTLHTDSECSSSTYRTGATVANKCYKTDPTTDWHSAIGCSAEHFLRLHESTDCSDNLDAVDGNDVCSGGCASLQGKAVGSFKCVWVGPC